MVETILEIKNLHKSFDMLKATDNVSLDLRKGEIHALIGPNGAGKSTLIAQIAGTIAHDSGSLYFDGRDIGSLDGVQRAQLGLGRTFQVSSLMPEFSALRNVMLALQARQGSSFRFWQPVMRDTALKDEAAAILERVRLENRKDIPSAELSHGERRQLEIAIALALRSKALLLDEPMAGMGPEGSKQLTGFLDALRHEVPILLVEHDMDAVFALADRISVLVYGRIIAHGTAAEIRNNALVREAYLGETG
ncbi:ABC transporter ATP-binding protein [Falsochrobactrum shanghaiense]|uniref:ABC transporter ATP-binding protein n=1 Tax=Falsochrobactrum shanghaiense TaxID=2201899 RepID=A0A316JBF1_9HYPH|nr:ABC transporter ATP-binding protein [Falsochrobactrum shanghaiense]PWL16333.1 ABC transporter ATP-binding protein [Falsochrobactrum shanghaiense]